MHGQTRQAQRRVNILHPQRTFSCQKMLQGSLHISHSCLELLLAPHFQLPSPTQRIRGRETHFTPFPIRGLQHVTLCAMTLCSMPHHVLDFVAFSSPDQGRIKSGKESQGRSCLCHVRIIRSFACCDDFEARDRQDGCCITVHWSNISIS